MIRVILVGIILVLISGIKRNKSFKLGMICKIWENDE